jgi:hypothetical protein
MQSRQGVMHFHIRGKRDKIRSNALSNKVDAAKVQERLGHATVSTTRLDDRRKTRPEDNPTFRVKY